MTSGLATSPLFLAAVALSGLGAILLLAALVAFMGRKPLRFLLRTLMGLVLLSFGALAATIIIGIQGYKALTREEVVARITVKPIGRQRFSAWFYFPDGRQALYELSGDELYVDAHILKWKPLVNVLGLHTAYELDRVEGRYTAIQQERSADRTVYALGTEKPVDLFNLRQRYECLAPLLDAEYGSATFVPARRAVELELRVSTTGLLIRGAKPETK